MCLTVLAALAMIISSCGNGGTPSVATTTTAVTGVVTDKIAVGSTVRMYSMKTGAQVGADATTDVNGSFTIDADFTQYDSDDVFYTVATGGTVQGSTNEATFLKFKSILGSQTEMTAAGADGAINASEIPDLVVSNVTSAKVVLVEKKRNISMEAGQNLSGSVANIAADEKEQEMDNMSQVLKVAGAIKAIVDNSDTANANYTLGFDANTDLLDVISNTITMNNGVPTVSFAAYGTLDTDGAALEDDILDDSELAGGLSGDAAEAVAASDIAGTWYGYSVDTWGASGDMQGPQLHNMAIATTGGNCTTKQLYLTLTEDGQTGSENVCATLSGNLIKFNLSRTENNQTFVDEIVGTVDGNNIDGTFTVKVDGVAKSGGIFKFGKSVSTTSYAGTYAFDGVHTVLYLPTGSTSTQAVGDSGTLKVNFTVSGANLQGTVLEEHSNGTADTMLGELDGPRVKARLATAESTIFMVFLLNDTEVTGLYMEFKGSLTEPTGDPIAAGKFKLGTVTKS
jgi:hypothetical protein